MAYYICKSHASSGAAIYKADNIDQAKFAFLRHEGASNVMSVRTATDDEVEWHKAMGGRITKV